MFAQQPLVSGGTDVGYNDDFLPNPPTDLRDLFAFRLWGAEGWVRPMYFLGLIIGFLVLTTYLIGVSLWYDNGWLIFFAVVAILLLCVGSIMLHRICYEVCLAFLQIPKLVHSMHKLERTLTLTVKNNNNLSNPQPTSFQNDA